MEGEADMFLPLDPNGAARILPPSAHGMARDDHDVELGKTRLQA